MNRVLTTQYESENYFSLWQAYYALLQLLLVDASESADKYSVLAPDCKPTQYKVQEKRKCMWVKFYVDAYTAGVDPTTLPDITSCDDLDLSSMELA